MNNKRVLGQWVFSPLWRRGRRLITRFPEAANLVEWRAGARLVRGPPVNERATFSRPAALGSPWCTPQQRSVKQSRRSSIEALPIGLRSRFERGPGGKRTRFSRSGHNRQRRPWLPPLDPIPRASRPSGVADQARAETDFASCLIAVRAQMPIKRETHRGVDALPREPQMAVQISLKKLYHGGRFQERFEKVVRPAEAL